VPQCARARGKHGRTPPVRKTAAALQGGRTDGTNSAASTRSAISNCVDVFCSI
jgi:hypothetical protein